MAATTYIRKANNRLTESVLRALDSYLAYTGESEKLVRERILTLGSPELQRVCNAFVNARDTVSSAVVLAQAINSHSDVRERRILRYMFDNSYTQKTLDLVFTTMASLPSSITFTRADATTCATYFDSTGLLKTMGANYLLWSNDITQSAWTLGGTASKSGGNVVSLPAQNDNVAQPTAVSTSAVGYVWTFSVWLSGTGFVKLLLQDFGGAFPSTSSIEIALTSTPTPYQFSRTQTDATATRMLAQVFNSRSASPATVTVSQAQMERSSVATTYSATTTAANSGPRFDYDPVTLLPKGLLIEESRANLLLQSNAFTTTWANTLTPTVVQDVVGIDGATSAWTITDDNATGTEYISQSVTLTAVAHTLSVFVKKTTGAQSSYPVIGVSTAGPVFGLATIDTTNGTATVWTAVTGGTILSGCSATCQSVSSTFWRVSLTFTATAASFTTLLIPAATANPTQSTGSFTISVTGSAVFTAASLEAGAFPTSYIPTTTTSVTRASDSASMVGTAFSSWYNQSAGTFVAEATPPNNAQTSAFARVIQVDDGTGNNTIELQRSSGVQRMFVKVAGVEQFTDGTSPAWSNGTTGKVSMAYAANDLAVVLDGGTVRTDGSASIPTVTALRIGQTSAGASLFNGWIRRLTYYPSRLSNATLQALTS